MSCHENHKISYNQRAFIFENSIFSIFKSGPNEHIYTHYEMSYVFNLCLITPLHTAVYPCFFPHFLDFIKIHEYPNEIICI